MNNIFPIDVPLTIVWHLTKPDGTDFSLQGYSYRLFYKNGKGKAEADSTHVTASGNTISFVFLTGAARFAGEYSLQLVLFQNGSLFCTLNYNNAFGFTRLDVPGTANQNQEQTGNVVHLYTAAEYYLLAPVVPTVGDDGYWYVNGVKITDGNGEFIPSSHTVEYDAATNNIIIDRGRVDSEGHSITQTITAIADMISTVMEAEGTPEDERGANTRWGAEKQRQHDELQRQANEGDENAEPGDENRWGWEKQRQANEEDRQEAEGNSASTPGDGSRIGNELQRQANEEARQQAEGTSDDDPDDPDVNTRWAQYKRALAATERANAAAEAAEHEVDIHRGPGIETITQPVISTVNGGSNTIRITYSDGHTFDVTVRNGKSSAGFHATASALSTAVPSPNVGDYAFVSKAGDGTWPAYVYVCTTAGTWTATTNEFTPDDPTDVLDVLNSDSTTAALSAKQGKVLDGKISQLGQKEAAEEDYIKLSTGVQGLNFYQGAISGTTGFPVESTKRIRTGFLDNRTHTITVELPEGYRFTGVYLYNDIDYSSFLSYTSLSGRSQTFSEGKYIILVFSKTDQTAEIAPSDASGYSLVNAIYTANKSVIDGKVNTSDIVDDLTTDVATKPLSAKQGKALATRLGDFSDMDGYQYIVPQYTQVDDYWMKQDGQQSVSGTGKQYASLAVLAGEVYRISGYSTTNVPCCFVAKSAGKDVYLNKESGTTYQTFQDQIVTILNDGTMYVNGYNAGSAAQKQPLSIEKKIFVEGSARLAIDEITAEIDEIDTEVSALDMEVNELDGFSQLLKSPMPQAYEYRSADAFVVASKFIGDSDYDLVQVWKKCLQQHGGTYLNTIFTFYQVKKFENTNPIPDASVVTTGGTLIFTQSSDCILATRFCDSSTYAPGSNEEYTSGAHALGYDGNVYKTAETTSVKIYADGKELSVGDKGYAKQIDVIVVTDAYDPFALRASVVGGQTPVYDTLFVETMDYRIINGSIRCIDSREYKKAANLKAWGGFASMAFSLPYAYFPAGYEFSSPQPDGFGFLDRNVTIGVNDDNFDREDYPDFNHFIKRNSGADTFECVYLEDYGVGDHSQIPDNYSICWVYGGQDSDNRKVYHRVTYETNFIVGAKQRLSCIYGWFKPIINNAFLAVYVLNDLLFVDVKDEYEGTIALPEGFALCPFEIVKKTSSITTIGYDNEIAADGLDIESNDAGYAILRLNP